MLKKIKIKIKKNLEIFALTFLILITIIFTSYYNFNKKKILDNYSNLLDNVYFKKSLNQILENLEPRFKKIEHEINVGETFDKILEGYSVEKSEITQLKKELKKKNKPRQIKRWSKISIYNRSDKFSYKRIYISSFKYRKNLSNERKRNW